MKKWKIGIMAGLCVCLCGCSLTEENIDGRAEKNTVTIEKQDPTKQPEQQKEQEEQKGEERTYGKFETNLREYNDYKPKDILDHAGTFHATDQNAADKRKSWEDKEENYMTFPEKGAVSYLSKNYLDSYSWLFNVERGEFRENFSDICTEKNEEEEKNAVQEIEKILRKLQITPRNMESFYLDKKALNKLSQLFMTDEEYKEYIASGEKEFQRKYTEKDQAVLLVSKIDIGGEPLYYREYDADGRGYFGSYIRALVKDGKVIWLDISGAVKKEKETEKCKIISSESAEKKIQDYYKNVQSKGGINCKNEGISYVLTLNGDKYQAVPVYSFTVRYIMVSGEGEYREEAEEVERVIIDAVSGEWIR